MECVLNHLRGGLADQDQVLCFVFLQHPVQRPSPGAEAVQQLCRVPSAWHLGRVVSMEPVLFHLWERLQGSDSHLQTPPVWWEPLRGPGEANQVLQHRSLPRPLSGRQLERVVELELVLRFLLQRDPAADAGVQRALLRRSRVPGTLGGDPGLLPAPVPSGWEVAGLGSVGQLHRHMWRWHSET